MASYQFVGTVPEDSICSICADTLTDPVIVECCGQLFCEECLERWLQRKKSCPHCRGIQLKYIKNRRMTRMINCFKIYCPNCSKGCEVIITVSECSTHLETCLFEEVPCTNNCGVRMLRKKVKNHTTNECLNRTVICQYCNEEGMYKDITAEGHIDKCPSFPLDCPNNCGHDKIQRKDLPNHQKECPLEPVKCPFFEAGCKQEIPRKELAVHKASNTENHLELMMISFVNTQRQLKTVALVAKATQNQYEEAIQKYRITHQKLDEVTQKAKTTQDQLEEAQGTVKHTQDQLKATQDELKQLSLSFNGLALCATKQLLLNPEKITDIINIKTALEALTTMLKKSKQYCLPLVSTAEGVKRTPVFYIHPGYKLFVADAVYLLKGEHDEKIQWPMVKMNIELKVTENLCLNTIVICPQCGYTGNKLEGDQKMEEIERVIYPPSQAASTQMPDSLLITVMPHNCQN